MKICMNYLTELQELIKNNKLKDLDYIKYPSVSSTNLCEMEYIKDTYGDIINLHGTLSKDGRILSISDDDFIDELDVEKTKKALELSKTKGLSIHITEIKRDEIIDEGLIEKSLDIINRNVKYLKNTFDLKFLTIENKESVSFFSNPEFISKVIEDNDCLFLLDINHAVYSAEKLGINVLEYIDRLPLDKIYEIHACGWYDCLKTGRQCGHTPINEQCYQILDYVLKKSNPEILSVEFGWLTINGKSVLLSNFDDDMEEVKIEILNQVNRLKCLIEKVGN